MAEIRPDRYNCLGTKCFIYFCRFYLICLEYNFFHLGGTTENKTYGKETSCNFKFRGTKYIHFAIGQYSGWKK
jgi:hypothetical protein